MGCFKKEDDISPEEEISGVSPAGARKCRDVLCVLVFGVFWLGMLVIAGVGFKEGDPYRLLYATDYNGETCGTEALDDKPLIYYPRMNDDLLKAATDGISPLDTDFFGICVQNCPELGEYICDYEAEIEIDKIITAAAQKAERKKRSEIKIGTKECWFVPLESDTIFSRCLPASNSNMTSVETCVYPADEDKYYIFKNGARTVPNDLCEVKEIRTTTIREAQSQPNPVLDSLQTTAATIGRCMGDIKETYPLIFGIGAGLALIFGCLFLVLLKYCAGCVIWVVCWGLVFASLLLTLFLGFKGGVINNATIDLIEAKVAEAGLTAGDASIPAHLQADEDRMVLFKYGSYVAAVFTLIVFMVVCFFRKKIKITIGILREASKAVSHMPFLILFPIIPFLMISALFIYWVMIAAYVYSSGEITVDSLAAQVEEATGNELNTTSIKSIKPDNVMRIMFAYHFFGFLWTNQLIQAISMTTMAGAVSRYYWSRNKTTEEMGRFPILTSFKNCFRYHFGSLIFGSFIIAVVQFVRAVLTYIDKKTKNAQNANAVLKVAMKVIHCCLWCLEKCIKFLSKNAYIMIAMKGKGFCGAAKDAFFTIFANIAQVGIVSMISGMLLLLAKILIAVGCSILVFLAIDRDEEFDVGGSKELSSPVIPILLTSLLSWFVASTFLGVYEMAIDTILICFCEDKKINGTSGKFYMSDELQQYVESNESKE